MTGRWGPNDPRYRRTAQAEATDTFPLRTEGGKRELLLDGSGGLRLDPSKGLKVNVDGETLVISSASPYAVRARLGDGMELTHKGIQPRTSTSVRIAAGKLVATPSASEVVNDSDSSDATVADVLTRIDTALDTKATTAYVQSMWPIGSVYVAVVSTNPATLLGFGTWSAFGAGRVMVGLDAGDANFDTVEETGGAKTVAAAGSVSAPTFTGSALAGHTHDQGTLATDEHTFGTAGAGIDNVLIGEPGHIITGATGSASAGTPAGTVSAPTFTGSATSVVQPYVVCYFWKRTA